MKTDRTTKLLLASIAIGLFINAIATFSETAGASNRGQGVIIVGAGYGQQRSPIAVECINCR